MNKESDTYEFLMALDPSKNFNVLTDPDAIEKKSIENKAHPDHVKQSLIQKIKEYKKNNIRKKDQKLAAAEISNDIKEISLESNNISNFNAEEKIEPIVVTEITDTAISSKENFKDSFEK